MSWQPTERDILLYNYTKDILPKDFDYMYYITSHPDLLASDICTEEKAKQHYILHGIHENRKYKNITYNNIIKYEKWPKNTENILYFAPETPDFDKSSGGNRLYQILKILKNQLNYNIYFLCHNPRSEFYINCVKSLDIEVFYPSVTTGIHNLSSYIIDLITNKNIHFDCAIFSWCDMANRYIDFIRDTIPEIKIITDSVDVHWLRESRGARNKEINISDDALLIKKEIEKRIYQKSDVVFAVTNNDKEEIEKEIGYGNIKVLSNIHESSSYIGTNNSIIFIGNYTHTPNIQAAVESIKIFRAFKKTQCYNKLSNKPKLLIVGPNPSQKIIQEANGDQDIIITGFIENLDIIYLQAAIIMCPLYWGAGIKGKICDASMRFLPILTTDIGNEGIGLQNNIDGLIANNEKEFVSSLEHFYSLTEKAQKQIGINGNQKIRNIVSIESAINVLKHTLENKHVVISIVAYNQIDKLKNCLESIFQKTKYTNYTVVVTDNSDNNKIKNLLFNNFNEYLSAKKLIYIKNIANEYFIIPNNKIMMDPLFVDSDIVLINDDIEILSDGWLNYMYSSAYASNDIAAVGGKTIYPNGLLAEAGAELYNNGFGKNKGRNQNIDHNKHNTRGYTGYCSGCFLYMRRDAIKKIGVFDTDFCPMYYEDSEWQYRAHIHGLKTVYEPRAIAIHDEGSSSGTNINSGMKKYQEINRIKFIEKYNNYNIEQYN